MPYLATVVVAVLAINQDAEPALATECSLTDANTGGFWFGSAHQTGIADLEGSSAELWNYDPNPIFAASAFWTMLTVEGEAEWAQIGWASVSGDFWDPKQSGVFLQLLDSTGPTLWTGYLKSDDTWQYDLDLSGIEDAVHPTSEDMYEIYTWGSDWWFVYNHDTDAKMVLSRDFDPDEIIVAGEVQDYASGNKGDHAPGHTTGNPLQANLSKKNVNGTWSNTSLTFHESTGPFDDNPDNPDQDSSTDGVDFDNFTGDGIRVWDQRCSS